MLQPDPRGLSLELFLFQLDAELVAERFGLAGVETCTATDKCYSIYYCRYWLPRYHLPDYWRDSPPACEALEGATPEEAVRNLEQALCQEAATFFSFN